VQGVVCGNDRAKAGNVNILRLYLKVFLLNLHMCVNDAYFFLHESDISVSSRCDDAACGDIANCRCETLPGRKL